VVHNPLQRFSNPLQNHRQPITEDNYNPYTQIAVARNRHNHKNLVKMGSVRVGEKSVENRGIVKM
jgi:hypothetical protein